MKNSLLLFVFLYFVLPSPAFPESTGGTLGKQDKSISGSDEAEPSTERTRPAVKERSHPSVRESGITSTWSLQPRNENGSSAPYDGSWSGASYGNCILNGFPWNLEIHGGKITGSDVSGRVSGGGNVSGAMNVFSVTYDFKGHLSRAKGLARGLCEEARMQDVLGLGR
jgi:hypothetical protein